MTNSRREIKPFVSPVPAAPSVPAVSIGAQGGFTPAATPSNIKSENPENVADVAADAILEMPASAARVPGYWNNKNSSCRFDELLPVPPQIEEVMQRMLDNTYRKVSTRDRKGAVMPSRLRVRDVKRIENSELWAKYAQGKYAIGQKRRHQCTPVSRIGGEVQTARDSAALNAGLRDSVNEVFLFHGTSPTGSQGIASGGFKMAFAGSNAGTMFGAGLYFAECSSKSDEYAADDPEGIFQGLFCLLLCRVVCGEMLHMTAGGTGTHAIIDAAVKSREFESVLGDREASVGTYREFVVYTEEQVYPEYLILYRREFEEAGSIGNPVCEA